MLGQSVKTVPVALSEEGGNGHTRCLYVFPTFDELFFRQNGRTFAPFAMVYEKFRPLLLRLDLPIKLDLALKLALEHDTISSEPHRTSFWYRPILETRDNCSSLMTRVMQVSLDPVEKLED